MIYLPIIILALVQGITEFLPISSSGHLVLVHEAMGSHASLSDIDQKRLDIAVHVGTLFAVILYFRQDFMTLVMGGIDLLRFKWSTEKARQSAMILVASIPVIICGLVLFLIDISLLDSLELMAWMSIIFGIVLYIADRKPETEAKFEDFTFKTALFYGALQCLALIPGVSRSGITMTAGRFLGHSRVEAARMALLMGMVTIAAAGTLTGLDVFQDTQVSTEFLIMTGIGVILSFVAAYLSIFVLMRWVSSSGSFTPFVIYRILLGIGILIVL